MLIKIYFRCKPIYNNLSQKKLPSYKSKVYSRDNIFWAITYNKQSTKDLEQNKKILANLELSPYFEHMVKKDILPSVKKGTLFSSSTLLKNKILTSVKISAIFPN